MPINPMAAFSADIETIIGDKLLPLAQNRLVVYHLGEPIKMPKGRGTTYTKTRFNRLPLPYSPLQEAVPAAGNVMAISQVTAAVQQWGGLVILSDRATYTIKHDTMMKAKELIAIQAAETLERNTFNTLFGFTQVNTVNSRGSRFALQAGDTLGLVDLQRAQVQLSTIGAYQWMGNEEVNPRVDAKTQDSDALSRKMPSPHYIMVVHDFVSGDLRMQNLFTQASSYSDVNKLYNSEVGQWAGDRVVKSNMVPFFTGQALITGTPSSSGGALTSSTTYNIIVTLSDPMRQYETIISQVSGNINVSGPTGSISVVLPSSSYTYNVYIGTSSTPVNLGLSTSGPTTGPFQGQATQLAGGQTVVITGIGIAQVPPAPVATGLTVYPSWIFGKYAYSQIVLDDIQVQYLDEADKADPFNQLREVTWKVDYGTMLTTTHMPYELSCSQFSATFA
jgi:N4-gp56 family major capsid protein